MSVQASSDHACTPRDNVGPYAAVEIGYPSELEPLLMPFRDAPQLYTSIEPTLFVNVPADTVRAVIQYHCGLRFDSAQLPPLIDFDDVPPTPSPDPETEDSTIDGSPTSSIQVGNPPPPPPPLPPTALPQTGQLPPPSTLTDCELSQIT